MDLAGHFKGLPPYRKLIAGGAVALLVALTLPWVSFRAFGVGGSFSGWSGTWGVLAGIAAILLIGLEVLRASGTELTLPVPDQQVQGGLAGFAAVGTIILFIQVRHGLAFGAFLGLLVALVLGYAAYLAFTASGVAATPGSPPPAGGPPAGTPPAAAPPAAQPPAAAPPSNDPPSNDPPSSSPPSGPAAG